MLQQDKFQIELMKNFDRMPPKGAVLFCSWPKVKGAVGFTARCVGIKER